MPIPARSTGNAWRCTAPVCKQQWRQLYECTALMMMTSLISSTTSRRHALMSLPSIDWLPVRQRFAYKLFRLVHGIILSHAPDYVVDTVAFTAFRSRSVSIAAQQDWNQLPAENKKGQLTQRERATAVHVWRPTANKCKIRKNLYFSAQGDLRSLLLVSIETRVWLPISD